MFLFSKRILVFCTVVFDGTSVEAHGYRDSMLLVGDRVSVGARGVRGTAGAAGAVMTMGEESPAAGLLLPVLLRPVLTQLERTDVVASQTLRTAFARAEATLPGLSYDFVAGILRRADISVNMNESILRLQGSTTEADAMELRLNRSEDAFQELNKKSAALKKILSRIPDEITDRKTFLETIKEIASAIKKLLDAVNEVAGFTPGAGKQMLEQRKREFVKYSKRFSNTLKEYFKEGQANAVFVSALYLIHQTNQIMLTVKSKCE